LTAIKSPAINVGIIDPEGILKGSTINDRITKTARSTGKKLLEYSMMIDSFFPLTLFLEK
jgi:hypothetical protein